jgi:hypothetical protein
MHASIQLISSESIFQLNAQQAQRPFSERISSSAIARNNVFRGELQTDYSGTISAVKAEVRTRKKAKLELELTSITSKLPFNHTTRQGNRSISLGYGIHDQGAPHFLLMSFAMLF